jgi:prepilin-type processing-associated H-X9-DG protein/prepilin-type N-terminal cleavage/methylation domain-containing protein
MKFSTSLSHALPRHRCRCSTTRGFTLIELLIVIGVIAMLIALLLPLMSSARASALSVKCQAQERAILQAMMAHAANHDGYMPLTGAPVVGTSPAALEDPERQRYDYYGTGPDDYHLMTPLAALAPLMGQSINTTTKALLEADLAKESVKQLFVCPADEDGGQFGRIVWEGGDAFASYAVSDAVFGWGTSLVSDGSGLTSIPRPHKRLRGKLSRIPRPEEVFLFTDAKPRADGGWFVYCDVDADLTLRDFLVTRTGPPNNPNASNSPPPGGAFTWDLIDTKRHRARMNVAFADGHVENVPLTQGALSKISMNKGFVAAK